MPANKIDDQQLAEALLVEADRLFDECVLAPLRSSARPAQRVRRMAEQLADHYDGGRCSCLLETPLVERRPEPDHGPREARLLIAATLSADVSGNVGKAVDQWASIHDDKSPADL